MTLTLHAKRFFADGVAFRQRRGEDDFYASLIELGRLNERASGSTGLKLRYTVPGRSAELLALGYRAGVFNQFPISTEFAPVFEHVSTKQHRERSEDASIALSPLDFLDVTTQREVAEAIRRANAGSVYRLKPDQAATQLLESALSAAFEPTTSKLKKCWQQWSKWIVLTRYGYFQAWLRYDFKDRTAAEILTDTMLLQTDCSIFSAVQNGLTELPDYHRELASKASQGDPASWQSLLSIASAQPEPDRKKLLETAPYLKAIEEVLGRRRPIWETYLQWEIARILVRDFASDALALSNLNRDQKGLGIPKLVDPSRVNRSWYHDSDDPGIVDLPLRWRHTGIHIFHISRQTSTRNTPTQVEASDFTTDLQKQVACLFEGVPVRESVPKHKRTNGHELTTTIPPIRPELLEQVVHNNAASWTGELLLLTGDSALLCSLNRDYALVFDAEVPYLEYWKTILRGIAHLCEMHLLARQLRFDTAKMLAKHLEVERSEQSLIDESRRTSILLARARTASDASVIARGDYARDKFAQTSEAFLISQNLESAQRNIELVNAAIAQEESNSIQRTEISLNVLVAIYAVAAILLAVPPFWDSATNLKKHNNEDLTKSAVEAPDVYLDNQSFADKSVGLVVAVLVVITLVAFATGLAKLIGQALRRRKQWRRNRTRTKTTRVAGSSRS